MDIEFNNLQPDVQLADKSSSTKQAGMELKGVSYIPFTTVVNAILVQVVTKITSDSSKCTGKQRLLTSA